MKKYTLPILTGLLILALSACGSSAASTPANSAPATEESSAPATNAPTEAPAATESPATEVPTEAATSGVSFSANVMPILNNKCNKCHGIDQVKEGLDMTSYDNLMAGSFNGSVITPGDVNNSFLVEQITKGKMPKRGPKLTADEVQVIVDWVTAGAPNN